MCNTSWHAGLRLTRTKTAIYTLICIRPEALLTHSNSRTYRNPLVYAKELHDEMVGDNLSRKQLAERYEITSDRVTQWLLLLRLPKVEKERVLALGDHWDRLIISERELRKQRE